MWKRKKKYWIEFPLYKSALFHHIAHEFDDEQVRKVEKDKRISCYFLFFIFFSFKWLTKKKCAAPKRCFLRFYYYFIQFECKERLLNLTWHENWFEFNYFLVHKRYNAHGNTVFLYFLWIHTKIYLLWFVVFLFVFSMQEFNLNRMYYEYN